MQDNPRVYKALRNQLAAVLDELKRIESGRGIDDELLDTIELISVILGEMKGEDYCEKIRFGKQEKPFHEIIMQIGGFENTAVESDTGRLATERLTSI